MKLRNFALIAIGCSLASPLLAGNLAKPGRWQTTIQTEMTGMPMKMPVHTVNTCLTKEQADNAENLVPKSGDKRGGCTYSDVKVDGSTVTWKMTCENSGMTGTGRITYKGDSLEGSMLMKTQDREISVKYDGKYLGECDGTEQK